MKSATTLLILAGSLASVAAYAQMHGGGGMAGDTKQGMDMSTQQSQQMMGGQMMSQEMMRDMSGMMRQMNDMMQNLSRVMDKQQPMDSARMHDMSKLMQEMSVTMGDMSKQMAQGKMDPAMTKQMQERIKHMNQALDKLRKEKR